MASEGTFYGPLLARTEKAELELQSIILPPLRRELKSRSKKWTKKEVIIGAIIISVFVIVAIAVVAALSTFHPDSVDLMPRIEREEVRGEVTESTKDFQTHLQYFFHGITERNTPEDLKNIFEYYKFEVSDVEDLEDLKEFLVVLNSEGFTNCGCDLKEADISFTFNLIEGLHSWYCYLDGLKQNLTRYEVQKGLENVTLWPVTELDEKKVMEMDNLLNEWMKPMTIEYTESSVLFKKKIIVLSDVINKVTSHRDRFLNLDLYIFATNMVYLDEDVYLPETNLAIIAPKWSFIKDIDIVLSGLNATNHWPSTANEEMDGLPGLSGGNGGHFIGIGNVTIGRLRIHSSGGNGGDGQNGAKGRDGVPGPHNVAGILPPNSISGQLSCTRKVKGIMNSFGQIIPYVQVFDNEACGGNGTNGGASGMGGLGGTILLINVADRMLKYDIAGNGSFGNSGRGGAAGIGIKNACYYIAEGQKHGKLHGVTTTRCDSAAPSGFPGRDGQNAEKLREPIRDSASYFAEVLQFYRFYIRYEYTNGDKDAWSFLKELDDLPCCDIAKAEDFLFEMDMINSNEKVEFYESLNVRIGKAMEKSKDRRALTYLRALAYGRMLNLKREMDKSIIVDLDLFLEQVSDDLPSTSLKTLEYKDHTMPILLQMLDEKVNYLNDSLLFWIGKTRKILQERAKIAKPKKMVQLVNLTLLTARVLQSLLRELSNYKIMPANITGNVISQSSDINHHRPAMSDRFSRHETHALQELRALSVVESNFKIHLKNLKIHMKVMNNLIYPENEVSDFLFELDYFDNILDVMESVREKQNMMFYVNNIESDTTDNAAVKSIRDYLFDTLIRSQYKEALNFFRQWVFPHMYAFDQLLPKGKNLTVEEIKSNIGLLRKWAKEYRSTITAYDKYIREATFRSNNSIGEYYKWYNSEIRSDLEDLFKGNRILLTADVENAHILSKNAIKFKSVRLEFQSRSGAAEELLGALRNVQVEMRHSGYSYYYYNGKSYLHSGDGFDLRYSYELGPDGEPASCNMVYKKLLKGPAVFSPYTTWTVRLTSIPPGLMNFKEDVDIVLVGLGTYIEVIDTT